MPSISDRSVVIAALLAVAVLSSAAASEDGERLTAKPSFDLAVAGAASAAMLVAAIRYFLTVTVLFYAASLAAVDLPCEIASIPPPSVPIAGAS
jgi:hypothetical protein